MSSGNEQMQTEFHNKANAAFIQVCRAFEEAVARTSRRSEEYKFQQLKKQYATTLESQLQTTAKDILTRYRNERQVREVDQAFGQYIKDYLHRFIQKVNDQ